MKYKLEKVFPDQLRLAFDLEKEDNFEKHKIGYMRGDFGESGEQFFHTWFPCHEELKTRRFKEELQQVVDELRSDCELPLLKNRSSMNKVCREHPQNRVSGCWHPDTYAFKIRTEHFWYFIKCFTRFGDYNFYVNCFADDPEAELTIAKMEHEIGVLSALMQKLKLDDIDLWFDDGVLHAHDGYGNEWVGEEFYHFITEECLCFDEGGKLMEGMFVPENILNQYVLLSVANNVVPGADKKKTEDE